jgi:hypothetical protein
MTMTTSLYQSFNSDRERSAWIIERAEYWTVIRFRNRRYGRVECKTHAEAHWLAEQMVKEIPQSRYMIYAVVGNQSTYVETVS